MASRQYVPRGTGAHGFRKPLVVVAACARPGFDAGDVCGGACVERQADAKARVAAGNVHHGSTKPDAGASAKASPKVLAKPAGRGMPPQRETSTFKRRTKSHGPLSDSSTSSGNGDRSFFDLMQRAASAASASDRPSHLAAAPAARQGARPSAPPPTPGHNQAQPGALGHNRALSPTEDSEPTPTDFFEHVSRLSMDDLFE